MIWLVDPYSLYGWKRPFSIIQSENFISLSGLKYKSRLARVQEVTQLVNPHGLYGWKRLVFFPYTVGELRLIRGT